MSKTLVTYFSVSGVTKKVAEKISIAAGADLYEIKPEAPYTREDLNWNNKNSRSSIEMNDPNSRPSIAYKVDNFDEYDVVFVGFPIWWYIAPTIINTFIESYDFSGKTVVTFFTSGGSGLGNSDKILKEGCNPSANWISGKRFSAGVTIENIKEWMTDLGL
ncbi:flavodoxin [Clostridium saccharoperbutylacetonicum]|uniref:Flavodoxin n=1 Tax=Clostridium saccharoperbutylacetonicum N1-4(HMT) TaxID=931276 RepID=M1MGV2_9CLOT|nr:flavodoxin [Clostridium saccharoperbutylacetonicum]AGF55568.1 flavodoxin [Clostridium saccharoperbutylacetonicum N1-4(HMT)]NRT63711.1 flavodoxin [Clostridium saccharoperbutylacetonicum]NSB27074.1 flavodoxin [Clostridium saccharoperbutylacetonicum]NSB40559.1 flavodoxin [Clostridium saccharoperbutylacetonicum]